MTALSSLLYFSVEVESLHCRLCNTGGSTNHKVVIPLHLTGLEGRGQNVEANRLYITWRVTTSEELQRTILGLVLFNVFINDLQEMTECTCHISKWHQNGGQGREWGPTDMLEGRVTIQWDIGWRNGPTGTLWNSIRTNTRSCTWDCLAVIKAGDTPAGEQLCWEGPKVHGRQQTEHEPAVSSRSKEGQQYPGLY